MKTIFFTFLTWTAVYLSFVQPSNFTGRWKINIAKSEFDNASSFVASSEISVEQSKDSIFLFVVNIDDKGNSSTGSARYALDGKPVERILQDNIRLVGSFQFSDDKTQLVKTQTYITPSPPSELIRKRKEIWTLSNDGRTLTIDQTVSYPNGDGYSVKAVYDKQ